MSMNIKSDEAHQLARDLAELTGESLTGAVTEALRERLARLQHGPAEARASRLVAIGQRCAERLPDEVKTLDHAEFLYDSAGLPR